MLAMKRLALAVFILAVLGKALPQKSRNDTSPPVVIGGELPVYPPLARMARVEGDVKLDVATDGERVVAAKAEGHPLFVKAAEEYVKSWTFAKHTPTTFVTNFSFCLTGWTGCRRADGNNPVVTKMEASL